MQPLGPGFHFSERQTEIRAAGDATSAAELHVRVVDQFENAGDRPLPSIEARFPGGPTFGARNLRVTINGREVSLLNASGSDARLRRAPFDPVWEQLQQREIVTAWDLRPETTGRGTMAASATAFYVADETALPVWQPPSGIFVKGGRSPETETLTVVAPPDFRVLAPGKALKPTADGNLLAHRFQLRPRKDFLPYVVAGRYLEQIVRTTYGDVRFWTFEPLGAPSAQTAAARLAASRNTFDDFFGPAPKAKSVVRFVEAPGDLPAEFGETSNPGGASFPEGVLLDHRAIAQGVASEPILELAEYELARTWFGWRVRPTPEAQILMGRGAGLFGLVVAAEARGPDQRRRMIASLLERFDDSSHAAADRQLLEPPVGYSRVERISTGYRAALFFVALEDACGRENLRMAFRNILRARAGGDVSHVDLKAAAEAASGRNLAEMFRAWLNHPGIPNEFRARYGDGQGAQRVK